jgi:hypothetical protein
MEGGLRSICGRTFLNTLRRICDSDYINVQVAKGVWNWHDRISWVNEMNGRHRLDQSSQDCWPVHFVVMKSIAGLVLAAAVLCGGSAIATTNSLLYRAAPPDNPLKGFFPYAGTFTSFPHSMEWGYLSLRSLMPGPTNFDWTALDRLLSDIAQRGHQTVFRVYLDYPAKPTGIPQYLLDAGLVTHAYTDYGNNDLSVSPDYENTLLRQALTNFIAALGARYDGDPRVGFIPSACLGSGGMAYIST